MLKDEATTNQAGALLFVAETQGYDGFIKYLLLELLTLVLMR